MSSSRSENNQTDMREILFASITSAIMLYGLDGLIVRFNYEKKPSIHIFHPHNALMSTLSSVISLSVVWGAKPSVDTIAKDNKLPYPERISTTAVVAMSLLAAMPVSLSLTMNYQVNQPEPLFYRIRQLRGAYGIRGLYLSNGITTIRNGVDSNLMFYCRDTLPTYVKTPFLANMMSGAIGGFVSHFFNVISVRVRETAFKQMENPTQKLKPPSTLKAAHELLKTPKEFFKPKSIFATTTRGAVATMLMSELPTLFRTRKTALNPPEMSKELESVLMNTPF